MINATDEVRCIFGDLQRPSDQGKETLILLTSSELYS